ncbi:tyrosine-type recombinase/integrase [Rhodococcus artemisiae]|uniref:Tyrosine-type recombinase/integrase n=1 Tax=Rhodococcus artemisiae TaxID=714159 RepID=A0ABU7LCF6_9NOCA|nr:tyrosine-type recombinase/integrase [Rhodococcus artemisiae]MEE2058994.1 tyrosine-type recombinase/integrase [Rhodococcus artemisiae]
MPGFVAEALARQCEGKGRDDLLWPSRTGGFLGPPSAHDSWLSGAVRRCQLRGEFPRVTVHDLRHTAASLMVSAGANVKAIQRSLGHESAAMTLDTYAAPVRGRSRRCGGRAGGVRVHSGSRYDERGRPRLRNRPLTSA